MQRFKQFGTAARVGGKALYHLTAGAVMQPKASWAFVETVANAIADFDYPPDPQLPSVALEELFPSAEAIPEAVIEPQGVYELPQEECRCMAKLVVALAPRHVFEIGTNHGRTTRLIAELAPADSHVYTLDLPQDQMLRGKHFDQARLDLIGDAFRNHPVRSKITQLYGNSLTFDFSRYAGQMDLIFVDGDHSYEGVKSDTENALKMLAPGGVIVWDDYIQTMWGRHVMRWLHALAKTMPVHQLGTTRLVLYRAPRGPRA